MKQKNRIIKQIVWKELQTLILHKKIEFRLNRKRFVIRRVL